VLFQNDPVNMRGIGCDCEHPGSTALSARSGGFFNPNFHTHPFIGDSLPLLIDNGF
jgi:hypothetical protein